MRLYLDSCSIIYAVEGAPAFRQEVLKWLSATEAVDGGLFLTSRLSVLECRVAPMRDGDAGLLALFDQFLHRPTLEIQEVSAAVIERATQLRASLHLKTPDAIHVATAIEARADRLLTGDAKLARCTMIKVEVI